MFTNIPSNGTAVTVAHCKAQDLPIVDRVLEPQTIAHFLGFVLGSPLPNGKQPSLTRLTNEEVPFIVQENYPPGSNGLPIIQRVMSRIGSEQDGRRLCLVGKNIQSLKSRLWEGIFPLTEQRWREKELHRGRYFDFAIQHLSAVVAVFQYLNQPVVRSYLRDTFNLIYDHWADLDVVLNRHRTEKDMDQISVANLWTVYMTAHFEVMTERAHRWVIEHVDALRAPLLRSLASHQPVLEMPGMPDPLQWKITDRLHMLLEVSVSADYTIMIPMNGYKGYVVPQRERLGPAALYAVDCTRRGKAYAERLKSLSHSAMIRDVLDNRGTGGARQTSGESYRQSGMQQIESQDQVRRETRGAPIEPLPQERWITACMSAIRNKRRHKKVEGYGLAIYRLTYNQSESEWTEFLQKLEAHISDWGTGQTGSDAIKPHLKLQWLDGNKLGIAQDDIAGAKKYVSFQPPSHVFTSNRARHFNENLEDEDEHWIINQKAFLVVDSASYASYTTTSYAAATSTVIPGDFLGFLLAVDPNFDPQEGIDRPDESPGYHGQMRVLGNLVWGDLYSLLESQSSLLEDMWPLAMEHPNQVYVGPTVPWQIFLWRKQNAIRQLSLREIVEYTKKTLGIETSIVVPESSLQSSFESRLPGGMSSLDQYSSAGIQMSFDAALRIHVRGQVLAFLHSSEHPHHAVIAEEMMSVAPDEEPDLERIRQRLDEVNHQLAEQRDAFFAEPSGDR
ncbi:hypothetical protein N7492_001453 [Penicillium capsulatum]|uniref:Uncharacterized protein n=1 Tax=Penicillium capsulatum TaxID=69766 RepID=A0A9W9ITU1_9EURO|nr:hypothetical protein N7492_001453 [Penicillium capsulatum]KAJ6129493.1 hypothetical protein N7512_002273 [Penicillium capsulatum]